MKLQRWLWLSYVKAAIIPLLVVEIGFLAVFLISNRAIYKANVNALYSTSEAYLRSTSRMQAAKITAQLTAVSSNTSILASQTRLALLGNYVPPASERARYARTSDGAFYTRYDNGTTASFYTGLVPVGPKQIQKVWKLSSLDPLMMDLKKSQPLVASLYINTHDSYNRIYPYFDVLKQYARGMEIPDYNFYYLADGGHNPERKAVWTPAYIDPAGHGWMISSIAPVWEGDKLEAVVGQDVTLAKVIGDLLKLELPWHAYAILADHDGRIIAMPPKAERDLGVRELTTHEYKRAIFSDTSKPDDFNLARRKDTHQLALAMQRSDEGRVEIPWNGGSIASFSRIAGPEWHLIIVAPKSAVYADPDRLRYRLTMVAWAMTITLVIFYALFFSYLNRQARRMGASLALKIGHFPGLFERISAGDYNQTSPSTGIVEFDAMGRDIAATGTKLGEAHRMLVEQEQVKAKALEDLQKSAAEELRFLRVISHELRTPLSVIDSGAQIMEKTASQLKPEDIVRRAGRFRDAVQRISGFIDKLGYGSSLFGRTSTTPSPPVDACALVRQIAGEIVPADRLDLKCPPGPLLVNDGVTMSLMLRPVLDNATRYAAPGSPVYVALQQHGSHIIVTVRDEGPGLPLREASQVGQRFFRGKNAATIEGAGLGVFITKKIVETARGTFEFTSNPDTGTKVRMTLPITRFRGLAA